MLEPSLTALLPAIGPDRDVLQAYCDVLEEKWFLSEQVGRDVGLQTSIDDLRGTRRAGPRGRCQREGRGHRPRHRLDVRLGDDADRRLTGPARRPTPRPKMAPSAVMTTTVGTESVIQVRGLTKRYDDIDAVAGIDFEVARGEVFGLLGPNGAGKTTTVEILEGLRSPDGGTATVLGHDVAIDADARQAADRRSRSRPRRSTRSSP